MGERAIAAEARDLVKEFDGNRAVDGVSLTVNDLPAPGVIQVSLVPFTLQHTTLGERRVGDTVQLEGDTIGKYVREFMR